MKRRRTACALRGAVPLWADRERRLGIMMLVADGSERTTRSWELRAPPGTVAVVGAAEVLDREPTDEEREAVRRAAAAARPPEGPDLAPATAIPERFRPKFSAQLCGELAQGLAVADPDPPPPDEALDLATIAGVLDTTREHTPAPATPDIESYVFYDLPPDTPGRYLETVNGHPRDGLLRFVEDTHTYYVRAPDGTEAPTNGSVTHMAHKYEPPFDPDGIIQKFFVSTNWPRRRYSRGCGRVASLGDVRGLEAIAYVGESGEVLGTATLGLKRCRRDATLYVAERPMEACEIRSAWELLGLRAANRGTEIHFQIELFLNRDGCHTHSREFHSFARFAREVMLPAGMVAYRTEWRVFCEVTNIAGSVDCVVRLPDATLGIIDWKRSTKVREKMHATGAPFERPMAAPLDHLDGVVTAGYALQLNLYKHILEKHYGATVSCLVLVQVDAADYFYTFVPELPLEAAFLMAERRLENAAAALAAEATAATTDEHEVALRERHEAYEALMCGRTAWNEAMPPNGISLEAWRRGEGRHRPTTATAAAPETQAELRYMFGL